MRKPKSKNKIKEEESDGRAGWEFPEEESEEVMFWKLHITRKAQSIILSLLDYYSKMRL